MKANSSSCLFILLLGSFPNQGPFWSPFYKVPYLIERTQEETLI